MKYNFSTFGQYSIAQASIDQSQIHGSGGTASPMLAMAVRLTVSHGALQPHEGIEIISLQGKLMHDCGASILSRVHYVHHILQQKHHALNDSYCYLEFPISSNLLATFESKRGGGDVKLRMDLILHTAKLVSLHKQAENPPPFPGVWGYSGALELRLQETLTIPRDQWVSGVLPGAGYGVSHILEFPAAPIESCQALQHSFLALKQAAEMHKLGFYDNAVGQCRVAIEPFFERAAGKPVLKASWATKLGAATHAWLSTTLGSIKDVTNTPHHSPNAHYSQFDSQMILAVTTAVVAYIARHFKPEEM